jgi:hypothetical protein
VLVARYENAGLPGITVEIFDMGSPEDAYGVFSYSRDREQQGIGGGYQFLGSLLCFWQSRYFVCVQAERLTDTTRPAIEQMARSVSAKLPLGDEPPALLKALPDEGLVANTRRFFHIHPSLNYHYFLAEQNLLQLDSTTNCVLARYEPGQTYLLVVEYDTVDIAKAARESLVSTYAPELSDQNVTKTEDGRFVGMRQNGNYMTIVLDAETEQQARDLVERTAVLISVMAAG